MTIARNRFMAATPEQALDRMHIQSYAALEAVNTVNNFSWVYTNAGVLAEACAHWAFTAHPELRAEDDTFWN